MKQIQLADKKYDLYFGFEFLKEIKARFYQEMNVDGQIMILRANGLESMFGMLDLYDPLAVIDVIRAGTATLKQKPSNAELEQFIIKLSTDDEYIDFVKELKETIQKEPLLSAILKNQKQ